MEWFTKHPELLDKELNLLNTDSNYRVSAQYRDQHLVVCGEIIVRQEKTIRYPVLLIYPKATPYALPSAYPLKSVYTFEELKNICTNGSSFQIAGKVKDNIEFHYHRHQNSDGSLCLLESDNLDIGGSDFYSATSIIERLREWFAGLTSGNMPLDSPEVELFHHFPNQDLEYEILYPDSFNNPNVSKGEIYAELISFTPEDKDFGFRKKLIYFGSLIIGTDESGIFENKNFYSAIKLGVTKEIDSLLELEKRKIQIQNAIEDNSLLKIHWIRLESEPKPFKDFSELANQVGAGSESEGNKILFDVLGDLIHNLDEHVYFGLQYPNRRNEMEWQFFVFKKESKSNVSDFSRSLENFLQLLGNYKIYALRSELFSDKKFHARNSNRAKRECLSKSSVDIVGCGALGSEIADCLGKAGINLGLIDKEEFRAHNSVRHLVGTEKTGALKSFAVAARLLKSNPFIHINPLPIDILGIGNDLVRFLGGDFGISSIADDNTEGFLNEICVVNNKSMFYARALRGGKAARIFRVIPTVDACFHCLKLYREESNPDFLDIPEDTDFPTITNECNNPIRPASAADLKLIAAICSRLSIDHIQDRASNHNHWTWSTEQLDGSGAYESTPFQLKAKFLPPHSDCYYCKPEKPITLTIQKTVLEQVEEEIGINPTVETGGVLIGSRGSDGSVIVKQITGPGPKARKERYIFEKDIVYCQKELNEQYVAYGTGRIYVGEWHYHTSFDNSPSPTDLKSLGDIALQKEYLTDKPLMIIFSNKLETSCTVHPANKTYYKVDPIFC
jgi:integrative and conjugative element protein (TIGR02256 family)